MNAAELRAEIAEVTVALAGEFPSYEPQKRRLLTRLITAYERLLLEHGEPQKLPSHPATNGLPLAPASPADTFETPGQGAAVPHADTPDEGDAAPAPATETPETTASDLPGIRANGESNTCQTCGHKYWSAYHRDNCSRVGTKGRVPSEPKCLDCDKPVSSAGKRCNSCAAKARYRSAPQPTEAEIATVPVSESPPIVNEPAADLKLDEPLLETPAVAALIGAVPSGTVTPPESAHVRRACDCGCGTVIIVPRWKIREKPDRRFFVNRDHQHRYGREQSNYAAIVATQGVCGRCGGRMGHDDDMLDPGPYCTSCGNRPRTPLAGVSVDPDDEDGPVRQRRREPSHGGSRL